MTAAPPTGPVGRARRAAAVMGWDLPLFAGATAIDQGGRLVISLAAAAILGPAAFGTWVILALFLQYTVFLSFGIPNGAGREIPRLLGAGDAAGADATEDIASTGVLVTGVIAAIVAMAVAPWVTSGLLPTTIALLGAAVLLQQLFLFVAVLLRSRLRFRSASIQLAAQGLAGAAVGILLLLAGFGVDGILLARVTVVVVALVLARGTLARVPRPRIDLDGIRRLMAIGLPLMAAGVLLVLLVTIDRWIVLALLGQEALGVYGLVGLAASSLVLVPSIISQQYYPRLAYARGEGADGATLLRMARGQGLLAGGLGAGAALVIVVASWIVIPAFLPAYEEAMVPIAIVVTGMVAYAAGSAYGNLLNLFDLQRRYLTIQGVVLALDVALGLILVSGGLGIVGAALASAISMTGYAIGLHLASASVGRLPGDPSPHHTSDRDVSPAA